FFLRRGAPSVLPRGPLSDSFLPPRRRARLVRRLATGARLRRAARGPARHVGRGGDPRCSRARIAEPGNERAPPVGSSYFRRTLSDGGRMTVKPEEAKTALVEKAIAHVRDRLSRPEANDVERFARAYYAGAAPEDLVEFDLYGAALAHWHLLQRR